MKKIGILFAISLLSACAIKDASSGKMVWSGSIQRTHTVSPGEFMHTDRASIALLDSFMELLVEFTGEIE